MLYTTHQYKFRIQHSKYSRKRIDRSRITYVYYFILIVIVFQTASLELSYCLSWQEYIVHGKQGDPFYICTVDGSQQLRAIQQTPPPYPFSHLLTKEISLNYLPIKYKSFVCSRVGNKKYFFFLFRPKYFSCFAKI